MPIQRNNSGTAESVVPYVNQSGSPVECNVYVNQGGTAVPIHEVVIGDAILDDFESYADSAAVQSEWDTSFIDLVTSGAPNGSQAITSNDTQTYGTPTKYTSEDGEAWSCLVEFTDASATGTGVLMHIQDTSGTGTIIDDTLRCRLDLQDDELDITIYENDAFATGDSFATSEALATGTVYRVELEVHEPSGTVVGRVWNDDTDTKILDEAIEYEPAWSSGTPGIYFQDSGLAMADDFRRRPAPERGLSLDDSNPDYVTCPADAPYSGLSAMTVSFWIRPDAVDQRQTYVGKYDTSGDQRSWYIETNAGAGGSGGNGDVWAFISDDGAGFEDVRTPTGVISAGTLHHIAAAYDPPNVAIYVDGVEQVSEDSGMSGLFDNASGALEFARATYSAGREYGGELRDVKIHDFAFDGSDASQVAGGEPITAGVVGNWPLEHIESGSVVDVANGNDGTISGSPSVVLMED